MIKFLYPTFFDTATITSLSAATNHGVSNLADPFLKKTWRSTGLTNEWVKFDLGSSKAVDLLTFFNLNLTTSATMTVYAHASDLGNTVGAWASATFTQAFTFNTRAAVMNPTTAKTFRWWLVAISDSTNTNGYIEMGRVFGGTTVAPSDNFSETFTETVFDPSDITFTTGQTLYAVQRERYSQFDFQFNDLKQADQVILRNFFALVYRTEPFVIMMDYTSEPLNLTRYGVFSSDLILQWTVNNRASIAFQFKELR